MNDYVDKAVIEFDSNNPHSLAGQFWTRFGYFPGKVIIIATTQKFTFDVFFTRRAYLRDKPDLVFVSWKFFLKKKINSDEKK